MCISAWRKYFYYCTFRIGQIIVNSAIEFRVHKPEIIEEHFCVMSICWPSTFGKHHPLLGCWPKNRPNPLTPSNWQCVERTIFCRIVDFGPTSCSQLFEYASILFDCSSMRLFDYSSVHYVVVWQRSTDILLSSHELYLGMPAWKSCQAAVRAACAGPGYQLLTPSDSCSSFGPGPAAAFNCHLDFQAHVCSTRSFFSFVRQKRICSEMARKNAAKTIANAEDDDWLPDLNANVGNVHCGVKELAGFSTEIVLSKLLKSLFISFWL